MTNPQSLPQFTVYPGTLRRAVAGSSSFTGTPRKRGGRCLTQPPAAQPVEGGTGSSCEAQRSANSPVPLPVGETRGRGGKAPASLLIFVVIVCGFFRNSSANTYDPNLVDLHSITSGICLQVVQRVRLDQLRCKFVHSFEYPLATFLKSFFGVHERSESSRLAESAKAGGYLPDQSDYVGSLGFYQVKALEGFWRFNLSVVRERIGDLRLNSQVVCEKDRSSCAPLSGFVFPLLFSCGSDWQIGDYKDGEAGSHSYDCRDNCPKNRLILLYSQHDFRRKRGRSDRDHHRETGNRYSQNKEKDYHETSFVEVRHTCAYPLVLSFGWLE